MASKENCANGAAGSSSETSFSYSAIPMPRRGIGLQPKVGKRSEAYLGFRALENCNLNEVAAREGRNLFEVRILLAADPT